MSMLPKNKLLNMDNVTIESKVIVKDHNTGESFELTSTEYKMDLQKDFVDMKTKEEVINFVSNMEEFHIKACQANAQAVFDLCSKKITSS